MKIFISYSTEDSNLVSKIDQYLAKHAEVFYWQKSKSPGESVWPLISSWIDQSDLVLVVITGNTVSRAMSVGQEVGRAKAKQKVIIPIVSSEVPKDQLGFLSDIIYEPVDKNNPGAAIQSIEKVIIKKKEENEKAKKILVLAGIAFLLLLASE
jgi:TIR domain